MTTGVHVDNLSIKFRIYHDRSPSLKAYIASLFQKGRPASYSDFWALQNISFSLAAGERLGIVGHNGAGESTLLKTLCNIYEPTAGSVRINGSIAPLLEIGAGFHPEFTGRENINLNGSILGYTQEQIREFEPKIIEFTELQEFIDTPVKYYSTGMYLRLAFAIATSTIPDILILDEMFAGGDSTFVKKATDRMHQMIAQANILILVSHDVQLLRKFCSRVIWLEHGRVVQDGPAEDVIAAYEKRG